MKNTKNYSELMRGKSEGKSDIRNQERKMKYFQEISIFSLSKRLKLL